MNDVGFLGQAATAGRTSLTSPNESVVAPTDLILAAFSSLLLTPLRPNPDRR